MADGFTKGCAFVAVGNQIIERRLTGAGGQGAPVQLTQIEKIAVMKIAVLTPQQGVVVEFDVVQRQGTGCRRAQPHGGLSVKTQALAAGRHNKQARFALILRRHQIQLGIAAQRHQGFFTVQGKAFALADGRATEFVGAEQRLLFLHRNGRLHRLFAQP